MRYLISLFLIFIVTTIASADTIRRLDTDTIEITKEHKKIVKISDLKEQLRNLKSQLTTYTDRDYLEFGKSYLNFEQQTVKDQIDNLKARIADYESR